MSQDEIVHVTQEVVRTVEVPVAVEQLVEKVVERIQQHHVPVHREEHVTVPVMTSYAIQNAVQV